jgi:hypothetical protein
MNNDELREHAKKRLKAKQDFYYYLLIWLGVSVVLTVIWFLTNPGGYFWPAWAIAGMGIAAVFQAIGVFGPGRGMISESAIDAEVNRMTKGNPPSAS